MSKQLIWIEANSKFHAFYALNFSYFERNQPSKIVAFDIARSQLFTQLPFGQFDFQTEFCVTVPVQQLVVSKCSTNDRKS